MGFYDIMIWMKKTYLLSLFFTMIPFYFAGASSDLLTKEENAWLESRNNTITVVPERNAPPFSYNSPSGEAQGIFIDYINIIAKKFGIKVHYLSARTRVDVLNSIKQEGNDYIINLGISKAEELGLLSTKTYLTTPVVLAVRDDYDIGKGLKLNDFDNKKVSVLAGSTIQDYVQRNYPKVDFEEVVDNELALHKVILAEVDAVVINMASLKYYLSTQTLSSAKVAGTISGLDVKAAFVVAKDQPVLRSILEKGLAQITPQEQEDILNKWQDTQIDKNVKSTFGINNFVALIVFSFGLIVVLWMVIRQRNKPRYINSSSKGLSLREIRDKIRLLKNTNEDITRELETIEGLEKDIEKEVESFK